MTNLIDLVDLSHLERFRSSDESIPVIDLVYIWQFVRFGVTNLYRFDRFVTLEGNDESNRFVRCNR